ncbi:MAG: iron chaperone, partial [Chloroflexi bacterium]|nr:iron chaperone [Chloroflexota bacterium]
METFMEWLETIKTPEHRARAQEVLQWVMDTYPDLGRKIAWNAPHFTDHGT